MQATPLVCLTGVKTQIKLTDLPYTSVSVFFISNFIRNSISVKDFSTLHFFELRS